MNKKTNEYKMDLKVKMDDFAHFVYKITKSFPQEERFGTTSQLRRAALSIVLNYIEGYARRKPAVQLNFFEISYGSAQESKYLLGFCKKEGYIHENESETYEKLVDEICAMLWTEIEYLSKKV